MKTVTIENWKLGYLPHSRTQGFSPKTAEDILRSACEVIEAKVPGNFELDLIRAGKLPEDLYMGTNILKAQDLERMHIWYCSEFDLEPTDEDTFLRFEGIDTVAEIFLDGMLFAKTENMLIPHEFPLYGVSYGRHELVVHIIPTCIYAREIPLPNICRAQPYNYDSLAVRKAPYMYGWDIMPRAVSAGLWRPVQVVYKPKDRIETVVCRTHKVSGETAEIEFYWQVQTNRDFIRDLSIRIEGECGDSAFSFEKRLVSVHDSKNHTLENAKLWWPKNAGEPNLYNVTATLLCGDTVCDAVSFAMGIRTVQLDRTDKAGPDGKFRFIVNGKPVYALGTNWVPTDVFPSRHDEYTLRGIELIDDIGCNMVRCWGGNAYPGDLFYEECDRRGIMVWQDFAMGCATYPRDERFQRLLREEATSVVRRLRNHASIVLWAGDNECDAMTVYHPQFGGENPEDNILTRKVLKEVVQQEDGFRPYLPSSPYLTEPAGVGVLPAEEHLWGPRDWFKSKYYSTPICHFASETGYHGCPSPESLRKFMHEENITNRGDAKLCSDPEWLVHASSPEATVESVYAYRIPLMAKQVDRLFGSALPTIEGFAKQSQISQGEAVKYFIERFRIRKWYTGGLLWWNMIDGWPQVSDAIVDWYGVKKLAYHYIKRAQQPFCMMIDEPDENGMLILCAANDGTADQTVSYTVTNVLTEETVLAGECTVKGDTTARIAGFAEKAGYYRIEWNGGVSGENHYIARMGEGLSTADYFAFMQKTGFDKEFEGF